MSLPIIREQIEARVQDIGDIMTGNLTVQKSSYPAVMFDNTTTNSRGIISAWENSTVIQSVNIAGTSDNRRGLFIKNSNAISNVASSLTLRDWINGSSTEYKIYGEHNKPTPNDIGAAPTSHLHDQYYSSSVSRTANTVLAAPNGSGGAASFRTLVQADIPNLNASKITAGTLPVERGGTGQTTAKDAANAFINALDTGSSTPADNDYYISQYVNGGTTTTTYHRRPMSALWAYINGKVGAGYLKLSGGTLTGSLYGTNIIPSTAGTGAIGQSGVPWLNVHAQYFRVYDPNNVQTGFLDAPTAGTTSVQGETYLALGNSTASGSNGNSRGRLRLYGTSSGYIDLYATASTSNYSISLPAKSGVAVVTSSNAYGTTQVGSIISMTTSANGARNIFKLYPDSDTENNYGDILTIQSAGDLYIGAGESAEGLYGAIGATASENMYVSADSNVYIVPNCNTVANRKTFTFNTAGALVVPANTDYTTYKARNIAANTSALTAGSSSLSNGYIYLQYE